MITKEEMDTIYPVSRVFVYYNRGFKNDIETPYSMLMKPATVIRRYGKKFFIPYCMDFPWYYPDSVDVIFDHDQENISCGHFTTGVEMIYAPVV